MAKKVYESWKRWCSATGKRGFRSQGEVRKALKSHRISARLRSYRCPHCHDLHLTKES